MTERIRQNSPFKHLTTWKLLQFIVKSNDDVRQEQFAMQLISQMGQIWQKNKLSLWIKTYEILATGPNCGIIEAINDAMSIHAVKEKINKPNPTLQDYFE